MSFTSQLQKKSIATSPPIPLSTGMFGSRSVQRQAEPEEDAVQMRRQVGMPDYASLVANDPSHGAVQAKLTVGAPNDKYEQEADAMAAQVMTMPDGAVQTAVQREAMPEEEEVQAKPLAAGIMPLVQREVMPEEEEVQAKSLDSIQREEVPEEEEIQAKSLGSIQREEMPEEEEIQTKPLQRSADGSMQADSSIEHQLSGSKGGGSPLPDDVKSFMEPRFGADFSGVRVHTGGEAVQMSRDLNAQAFTHGQDVYFGAGKGPGKDELTAHELTHVVQQADEVRRAPQTKSIDNSSKVGGTGRGDLSLEALFHIMPDLGKAAQQNDIQDKAKNYLNYLNESFRLLGIDTVESQALFLAHATVESGQLTKFTEAQKNPFEDSDPGLNGLNVRYLEQQYPQGDSRRKTINPTGDWSYIGRGPLQVTHKHMYLRAIKVLNKRAEQLEKEAEKSGGDEQQTLKQQSQRLKEAAQAIQNDPKEASKPKYTFLLSAAFFKNPDFNVDKKALSSKQKTFSGQGPESNWMTGSAKDPQGPKKLQAYERALEVLRTDGSQIQRKFNHSLSNNEIGTENTLQHSPSIQCQARAAGDPKASTDPWDRVAQELFSCADYEDYCANKLKSSSFFGRTLNNIHEELAIRLQKAESSLKKSHGENYVAPPVDSILRKRQGMHGWGMAIDFNVLQNPYVAYENGEKELDKELLAVYNRIAEFVLAKQQSDISKLKGGRSAFGGSVEVAYDRLHEESDAMKRYFSMMSNKDVLREFISNEWLLKHPGQTTPSIDEVQSKMKEDYIVLGGVNDQGKKKSTQGKGDRPFAPKSSGGKGDPATGFLNLNKEFVMALTESGLAWGAIDIPGEPGDIQHFDLRLTGIGSKTLELTRTYKRKVK
jgi:hypothetical protein